jgi:hypothetical protein
MHYSFGKSEYDSTVEKKLINASRENPALIYQQKSNERLEQISKLLKYIEQNATI